MSLKLLKLGKAYSSDSHDILHEFYIPVLGASVEYSRLAGFFSSKALAVAASGITEFLKNKGVIKMVVSPRFSRDDVHTISNSMEHPEEYTSRKMLEEINNIEEDFIRDHLQALGWMLVNNLLEIKVAIPLNNSGMPLNQ
ncbi:MAG: hypothetical protein PHU49_04515 [Syntrophorhabdaceae bacterium]|nr:hypothetical protein [Syntrophorhabdaceae bacterium]MDD5243259.1 hypothetical protein [Syntrophorhabdaceae bacterium]